MTQEDKGNFILGCNEIVDKGPIPSKEVSWDEFIELCRQG